MYLPALRLDNVRFTLELFNVNKYLVPLISINTWPVAPSVTVILIISDNFVVISETFTLIVELTLYTLKLVSFDEAK